jgi:hypothetical protein
MKIFTLLETEAYFNIINNLILDISKLTQGIILYRQDFLIAKKQNHIHAIKTDTDKQSRILYILRYLSNNDKYNLIDYTIIGNYEDVVIRLEDKESNNLFDFS